MASRSSRIRWPGKVKPGSLKELHARLVAWRKEVNAPMPTKNDETATTGPPKKKGNGKNSEQ